MQLQVQLVHAEGGRLVVHVTGWNGDQFLGSALGEAGNAEEAEDRALARLQQRLNASPAQTRLPGPERAPERGPARGPEKSSGQIPVQVQSPAPAPSSGQALAQSTIQAPAAPAKESPGLMPERAPSKEPSLPGAQAKPVRPQGPPSPLPAALTTKATPGTSGGGAPEPATALPSKPIAANEAPADAQTNPETKGPSERSAENTAQLTLGANSTGEATPARSTPPGAGAAAEQPADPEDWSDELAALDIQLQRLGWQRDQESIYLQRAFGHPSRSRLTSYGDLVAYLAAVRQLQAPADPTSVPVPMRRVDLLAQSDELLAQLGWDAARGREVLETHFQRSSRQQLNDEELLRFNMVLEGELFPNG